MENGTGSVSNAPKLMTKSMKKELRKGFSLMLKQMNDVIDSLHNMDPNKHPEFMKNQERNKQYATPFSESCGINENPFRFEAGSIALSQLLQSLIRHKDNLNSELLDDDVTSTFSFLIPSNDPENPAPKRLTIIGYTRNCCAQTFEKETGYGKTIWAAVNE